MGFRFVVLAGLLTAFSFAKVVGQSPSTCFEIESILVDACGTPEGANEMILFHVGPNPLNVSNLSAVWPNTSNPWLGTCQNANTIAKVAQLNANIQACGLFVEPVGGILPSNSRILLITSEDFDPNAHDFTNLSDTLTIIFQCAGNTGGHFANASSSGLRSVILGFSSPAGCLDTVIYSTQSLVDTNGVAGGGPSTGARNGATVNYTWGGSATYTNDGCRPPYTAPDPNAGQNIEFCPGQNVFVNGSVSSGNYPFNWYGGDGTFSNPNSLNPIYVPGAGDTLPFYLYLREYTGCDTSIDSILLTPIGPPSVDLGPDREFCQGTQVVLDAGFGQPGFQWSNGATTQTITVNQPGVYWVSVVNQCFSASDTIELFYIPVASVNAGPDASICPGDTFFINGASASGPAISWSGGSGGFVNSNALSTAYIPAAGENGIIPLILSLNDTCGVISDTLFLSVGALNPGNFNVPSVICYEDSFSLSYTGPADSVRWIGAGQFADSLADSTTYVPAASDQNVFSIIAVQTSGCQIRQDTLFIVRRPQINVTFSWSPSVIVPGMEIVFTNQSTPNSTALLWDFGDGYFSDEQRPRHFYSAIGDYSVLLQVEDEVGCPGQGSLSVPVIWGDTLVPNVFTPNGDGINDQLDFALPPVHFVEIQIYDRWGRLQFSSSDVNVSWDGKKEGNDCPEGVYFFSLRSRLLNGDRFDKSGSVTLLR